MAELTRTRPDPTSQNPPHHWRPTRLADLFPGFLKRGPGQGASPA